MGHVGVFFVTPDKIVKIINLGVKVGLEVMRELTRLLSLYVNFFRPSMKLKEKRQKDGRIRRIYDQPKTPYQRVLEHPKIPEETKERLRKRYEELNPAELRRKILGLQQKLFGLATPVKGVEYE